MTLPCNPESTELLAAESITISSDNFCVNGTQNVKQFSLRLHVTNSRKPTAGSTSRPTTRSRDSNGSDLGDNLNYYHFYFLLYVDFAISKLVKLYNMDNLGFHSNNSHLNSIIEHILAKKYKYN